MKEQRQSKQKDHEYGVFTEWKWPKALRKYGCEVRGVAGAISSDKVGKNTYRYRRRGLGRGEMGLKHPLWLQGGGRIRCGDSKHTGQGEAVVQRRDDMKTLMTAVAPGRRAWGI